MPYMRTWYDGRRRKSLGVFRRRRLRQGQRREEVNFPKRTSRCGSVWYVAVFSLFVYVMDVVGIEPQRAVIQTADIRPICQVSENTPRGGGPCACARTARITAA